MDVGMVVVVQRMADRSLLPADPRFSGNTHEPPSLRCCFLILSSSLAEIRVVFFPTPFICASWHLGEEFGDYNDSFVSNNSQIFPTLSAAFDKRVDD